MGNTSPSIEPFRANAYRQDTLSGAYLNKNKYLDIMIKEYCEKHPRTNYDAVWSSIISNDGSVQHITQLTDEQKAIFKTSMEIDQRWLIEHAADRQMYVDQAQSLNLFFRPDTHISYLHAVHFLAWKSGVKTLYYCRSEKLGKADKVSKRIEREIEELGGKPITKVTEIDRDEQIIALKKQLENLKIIKAEKDQAKKLKKEKEEKPKKEKLKALKKEIEDEIIALGEEPITKKNEFADDEELVALQNQLQEG